MKKLIISIIAILILVGIITYYLISPVFNVIESDEPFPLIEQNNENLIQAEEKIDIINILSQGSFVPKAHEVKGRAILLQDNNKKILRFEDFETINGPDLHIYLASDLSNSDFIDLGQIKATKGNVNYEVPFSVDTSKYNKVLIWCVPFKVLFSYAELN